MAGDNDTMNETAYRERLSDLVDEPSKFLLPIRGYEEMPLVSLEEAVQPIKNIVPNINENVYIAKVNYKDQPTKLTADLSAAITIYTMSSTSKDKPLYYTLNSILRSSSPDRRDQLKCWFLYLKLFITALSHLPSYRGTIYRGVKQNLSDFYTKDKQFVWWGFSSCTTSISVLQSNVFLGDKGVGTLFIIDSFTGKDIREYSYYEKEDEVLLVAARGFIVVDRLNLGPDLWIIHIKEIEPPFPFLKTDNSISSTFEIITPSLLTVDASTNTDALLDVVQENETHHQEIYFDAINETISIESTTSHGFLINSDENRDITTHYESAPAMLNTRSEKSSAVQRNNLSSEKNISTHHSLDNSTQVSENIETKLIKCTNTLITDEIIQVFLKSLANSPQLHTLYLLNNKLGDEHVHSIMYCLVDRSLLKVFIIDNEITDVGVASLTKVLISAPKMLSQLNLDKNLITHQGVILLMNALAQIPNSSLKTLSLSRNPLIGDECIDDIISTLTENQSLRCLYLEKCNLSDDGKERLRNTIGKKNTFSLQI
ncbi:hypothetical protein I4U23_020048 [Adineta vaga]|nr:hypothetical protein I4U23_020048 [Adineta vaga]